MEIGVLVALFTAFNIWGMYGHIPYTVINPTRTFVDRAVGSLQLTASIYSLCVIRDYVDATFPIAEQMAAASTQPHPTPDTMKVGYTKSWTGPVASTAQSSGIPSSGTSRERLPLLEDRKKWYQSKKADDGMLMAIVGLLWIFIIGNAVAEKLARKGQPQDLSGPSSDTALQGLDSLLLEPLQQKIVEPLEKMRVTMDESVATINAAAARSEGLPLSSIRSSLDNLNGVLNEVQQLMKTLERKKERSPGFNADMGPIKVHVDSIPKDFSNLVESLGTAVATAAKSITSDLSEKPSYGSSGLEILRKENRDLKREMESLRDRFDDLVEGLLEIKQSRSFTSKIGTVEKVLGERLGALEIEVNSLKDITAISVSQAKKKIEAEVLSINRNFDKFQNDIEDRLASLEKPDPAPATRPDEKMEKDIRNMEDDFDIFRTEINERLASLEKNLASVYDMITDIGEVKRGLDRLRTDFQARPASLENLDSASVSKSNQEIKTYILNMKARLDKFDQRLRFLENTVMGPSDSKHNQEMQTDILNMKDSLLNLKDSLDKFQTEINERLDVLENKAVAHSDSQTDRKIESGVEALLKELETRLSNIISKEDADYKQLNLHVSNVDKNMKQLWTDIDRKIKQAASKETVEGLRNYIYDIEKHLDTLQKEVDAGTIDEIKTHVSSLENELRGLWENMETQLSSLKDMIPTGTVYQPDSNLEMGLQKLQSDMEERLKNVASKETVNKLSEKLSDLEEHLEKMPSDMEERLDKMASAETLVNKLSKKMSDLEKDFKRVPRDVEEQLKSLSITTSDMEEKLNNVASTEVVDQLSKKFSNIEKRLQNVPDDVEERLKNMASTDTVDTLSRNLDLFKSGWDEDRKKLHGMLETHSEKLSRANDEIESAKSDIAELSTLAKSAPGVKGVQTEGIEQKEFRDLETTVKDLRKEHDGLLKRFREKAHQCDTHETKLNDIQVKAKKQDELLHITSNDATKCIEKLGLTSDLMKWFNSPGTPEEKRKRESSPTRESSGDKGKSPESGSKTEESPEEKSGPPLSESRWATSEPSSRSTTSPGLSSPSYDTRKKKGRR